MTLEEYRQSFYAKRQPLNEIDTINAVGSNTDDKSDDFSINGDDKDKKKKEEEKKASSATSGSNTTVDAMGGNTDNNDKSDDFSIDTGTDDTGSTGSNDTQSAGTGGSDNGDMPSFDMNAAGGGSSSGEDAGAAGGDDDFSINAGDAGGDDNANGGGMDGDGMGDDTSGGDNNNSEGLGDTSETDQKIDAALYDNLTDSEKSIRAAELKAQFRELYLRCNNVIDKIKYISPTPESTDVLKHIVTSLSDLKEYIAFYLEKKFDSMSYIDNDTMFNKYLAILNGVKNVLNDVADFHQEMNGTDEKKDTTKEILQTHYDRLPNQ